MKAGAGPGHPLPREEFQQFGAEAVRSLATRQAHDAVPLEPPRERAVSSLLDLQTADVQQHRTRPPAEPGLTPFNLRGRQFLAPEEGVTEGVIRLRVDAGGADDELTTLAKRASLTGPSRARPTPRHW